MNSSLIQRILDREFYRREAALEKNFEYLERLDRARNEAILNARAGIQTNGAKKKEKNTGVYITGLTTYIACKQLENLCHKLGRVKRIKFYKDERGSLKGDALVVFGTFAMMESAIAKLNNLEIKPGVHITATTAEYSKKEEIEEKQLPQEESSNQDDMVNAFLQEIQQEIGERITPEAAAPSHQEVEEIPVVPSEETNVLEEPSRSIILRGILDADTSSDEFLDLEEDLQIECSKYGQVVKVSIQAQTQIVVVEFEALDSAIKCLKVMNGRWFGGQQIQANFDPSKPEAPQDPDLMLEAFLASV